MSLPNADEYAPRAIGSLHYFTVLVEKITEIPAGEDYWKHIEDKVFRLEKMWLSRAERAAANPSQTK